MISFMEACAWEPNMRSNSPSSLIHKLTRQSQPGMLSSPLCCLERQQPRPNAAWCKCSSLSQSHSFYDQVAAWWDHCILLIPGNCDTICIVWVASHCSVEVIQPTWSQSWWGPQILLVHCVQLELYRRESNPVVSPSPIKIIISSCTRLTYCKPCG
jgi:hypothetical protein